MTTLNRRALLEATGASLLGLTVTGTASGVTPANEALSLLEATLAFDFGDARDLDLAHSDRPLNYALDPDHRELRVRTVTTEERAALRSGDRLVNFRGIEADVDSIGGITVKSLPQMADGREVPSTYAYSEEGYDMPVIGINWDAGTFPEVLSSGRVRDVRVHDGLLRARLPSHAVDVRRKRVRDAVVADDGLPTWKRSIVIERPNATVEVTPYLTVALHRNLDIVDDT